MIKATKTILILLTALALALGCLGAAAEGPTPWAKLQEQIDSAADGGTRTIILRVDLTAQAGDAALVIPEKKKITLDLNGKTIDRARTASEDHGYVIRVEGSLTVTGSGAIKGGWTNGDDGGVYVAEGGSFTLNSGAISGNTANNIGGGVYVNGGSLIIKGGSITGNTATGDGGGVAVVGNGSLSMSGGSITNNHARAGGGVYMNSGSFELLNASTTQTITGNTATASGGGVYLSGGAMEMSAGEIAGNTASDNGGGVYVYSGKFDFTGSTIGPIGTSISGNIASWGGGVGVFGGTFNMKGNSSCSIIGNTARSNGGGVAVSSNGSFVLSNGGSIIDNHASTHGGGVYVNNDKFSLSGDTDAVISVTVSDNSSTTDGSPDNVYLAEGKKISVRNPLVDAAIGVGMETPGTFTAGYAVAMEDASDKDPGKFFSSDVEGCKVALDKDGEAIWGDLVSVSFLPDNGSSDTSQAIVRGWTVQRPYDPEKEGHVFEAWHKVLSDDSLESEAFNFDTQIMTDTILKARWLTPWAALQAQIDSAESGATVSLPNGVTAGDADATLNIPAGKTITLDLAGHTLDRGLTGKQAQPAGNVITVNGTLTVKDTSTDGTGKITGGNCLGSGGGVYVMNGGSFTLESGAISGNNAEDEISSSTEYLGQGGGVYVVKGGTFTMAGGAISDNHAQSGAGVHSGGTFIMNGGVIGGSEAASGNQAKFSGGGVYVDDGIFSMSGSAVIRGNTASEGSGGGVFVRDVATFKMSGGAIAGNTAEFDGGGVIVYTARQNNGTFNMTGGEISGNTAGAYGGGVDVRPAGKFTLSGKVNISGNQAGNANSNVYLSTKEDENYNVIKATITISGRLENESRIGVSADFSGAFTNDLNRYCTEANFQNDDENKFVLSIQAGKACLGFGTPDFVLPDSLKAIEANAFEGATMVESVWIPDDCTSIGEGAFKDCGTSVWRIRVPEECEFYDEAEGNDVFENCGLVYIFSTAKSNAKGYCVQHDNCEFVYMEETVGN